jgi:hypothetical protein
MLFKCVKIPIRYVIKNPDINLPKVRHNNVMKAHKIVNRK